jgi:hypothetical protein
MIEMSWSYVPIGKELMDRIADRRIGLPVRCSPLSQKFSLRHPRCDVSANVSSLANDSGDDSVHPERRPALENLTSGTYILLNG